MHDCDSATAARGGCTHRHVCVAMVLIGTSVCAPGALAQQSGPALEEVIVTAQRREENLQKVPIAASAFSGADLQQRGVAALDDLKFQAPALSVQEQGFLKFVNVRGIGLQVVNPSTSSGVAFYADGFFIPHETAIGEAYFDLERVEVLRGPQGTLVGQNSTGGAIYVVSKKPQLDRVSGSLEQTLGDYDWSRTRGSVNVPVNEVLALRIAANVEKRDSYYAAIAAEGSPLSRAPSRPGNLSSHAVRMQALYKPSETFELVLKQDIEDRSSDGTPAKPFAELAAPSDPRLTDPFTLAYDAPTKNDYTLQRTTAEMKWQLSDAILLRSLTGYQHQESRLLYDMDATAAPIGVGSHDFFEDTFQQEINLISTGERRLNWVLGAFYLRDRLPVQLHFRFTPVPEVLLDAAPVHTSYSLFGQATYDLSDQWQILFGGRISHDEKENSGYGEIRPFIAAPLDDDATTSTEPTGKVALNWFLSDRTTLYASVSKGYKAGGLNDLDAIGGVRYFDPETILAYETGLKTTLADGHVRVTGAIFYYDYDDFQVSVFNPLVGTNPITNAGKAELYGSELELAMQFGGFGANLAASYTHSAIEGLALIDSRNPALGVQDLDGAAVNYAPEWTLSAGVEYEIKLRSGTLTPRAQYAYTAEQYAGVFHVHPTDVIPSHSLVDAKLTYRSDGNWWLEAFGTNLADDVYVSGIVLGSAAHWGAPRQFGVRAGIEF